MTFRRGWCPPVLMAAAAVLAAPAQPATAKQCDGVYVVVDFAALGGGNVVGCAAGDPSSGIAALRAAGFEPTRAAQEPGYFVCRINGKPANDPCQRSSPASAYWSYWHGTQEGSWRYSGTGPADHDPQPGTAEGWAFGAGEPPSTPPPRDDDPATAPPPHSDPPASRTAPPAPVQSSRAPQPAGTTTPPDPHVPSASRTGETGSTAAPAGSPRASSPEVDAVPSGSPPEGGADAQAAESAQDASVDSSPASALLAGGLVALLIAAAAQAAWSRRNTGT